MTNPYDQAFPSDENCCPGLTKREYFAGLFMQALLTNNPEIISSGFAPPISHRAVHKADALIAALNDTEGKS